MLAELSFPHASYLVQDVRMADIRLAFVSFLFTKNHSLTKALTWLFYIYKFYSIWIRFFVVCGLNIERVTGKTRISYSGDVCKLVESKAFLVIMEIYINHFAPGNFAEKLVLKLQSWPKGFGTPSLFHVFLYGICS